jgi:hypothetical protein
VAGSFADSCAENPWIFVQELLVLCWDRFCFDDFFCLDCVRVLFEGDHCEAKVVRSGCGSQLEWDGRLAVVVQDGVGILPAKVKFVFHEEVEPQDRFVYVRNDAGVVEIVPEPELNVFHPVSGNTGAVDRL